MPAPVVLGGTAAIAAVSSQAVACEAASGTLQADGAVLIPLKCRISIPPLPNAHPAGSGDSAGLGVNHLANPSAYGYPDATNTGATGTLTVINGSVTLGAAGMLYSDKDMRGCIRRDGGQTWSSATSR
jgi:hypothetical protein